MCGIIAYIGSRQASPILVAGLKRLEYRGYDSAGVGLAVVGEDGVSSTLKSVKKTVCALGASVIPQGRGTRTPRSVFQRAIRARPTPPRTPIPPPVSAGQGRQPGRRAQVFAGLEHPRYRAYALGDPRSPK